MSRYVAASLVFALAFPAARADDEPLKPTNLEKLNTPRDEDDPHPAADGFQLFYAAKLKGKYEIMLAKRTGRNQPWPAGKPVDGFIRTKADDRSTFLTVETKKDPQYLFFATKKDLMNDNFDIFVALKLNRLADFTAPTPVNTVCSDDDELHPWLSADGKHLYFSRRDKASWHVYAASRSTATGAAGFDQPKRLDFPPDFHHPTVTPDGRTMYLQGPLENNRWGLFRSPRAGSGSWSKPEPLTALNNGEGFLGDLSPNLSRDGTQLFFASDRPGGKGGLDLYVIPTAQLSKKDK